MVLLREVCRTATFAWSPGSGKPLLVIGTRAGAVDADFSDESKLELWDLALDDQQQGIDIQPLASIVTDSKFYDIAWGPADAEQHPEGVIAGALENGSLILWDASKLASSASDAVLSHFNNHTGAIKTVQFNPLKPHILATAGTNGELFIHDVKENASSFQLGNPAARSDDIECLAWNRKVSHILATGGAGGFVTVWDLKTKKATLTLNNSRKPVSTIAWDPNNSTKLLTATPDDNMPVIFLWNLRNSNAPERTLKGHEQGVLSLSWCSQDSDLMLSSGKDNRTLVWNPQTAELYGELPEMTNWTFRTVFNPQNPSLSATASFDGRIVIQTLQSTNSDASKTSAENNLDGEEFFKAAQTQPQGASWTLSKAPAWLARPVGVSFGFGGKIVAFKALPVKDGEKKKSQVILTKFSAYSDVSVASEKFQEAIASGDLSAICSERMQQASTDEERADWKVMETLINSNPRSKIVEYLGLKDSELANGDQDQTATTTTTTEGDEVTKATGDAGEPKKEGFDFFGSGDGDDAGDDFLSNVTATKGTRIDNPFHLFSDSDTSVEKDISKALMLGNFSKATDICLAQERMTDAFLIANCGGQGLVDKVQSAYIAKKNGMPSYMRLLGSVTSKNLWDFVYNADLTNWKEIMAIICTFSDPSEFPDLCEALGDRMGEIGQRKDASFCYLVGSKLEKVVTIWITELEETEQADMKEPSNGSTFSVHARFLQSFIEKVTIFRQVTKFQDNEKAQSSNWKLATLYDKYTEYADILAGHGQLELAQRYLDLLPSEYPAAEIARLRVGMATKKPSPQSASARQQTVAAKATAARGQSAYGYQPGQLASAAPSATPYGGYGASPQLSAAQQPQYTPSQNPYLPQGGFQPPIHSGYGGLSAAPPPPMGPPRNLTPSQPPPPKGKKMDNWNDVPSVTKVIPRRSTPSAAPITSPFPGQIAPTTQPPPPVRGQRASLPPPPRGPPPQRTQSPLVGPPQTAQTMNARPQPAAATSHYVPTGPPPPPQPSLSTGPPPQMQQSSLRTASPYKAPPAGPPPSNRYAPAPAALKPQPGPIPNATAPPPTGPPHRPPPPSAYGAPPATAPHQNQYAAAPYGATQGHPGAPVQRPPPPQGPPPQRPPSQGFGATSTPPPQQAATAPPKLRLPPGDRSQIPENAKRMVEILTQDIQRVASKAPSTYAPQVKDTQKRLNLLFDHLNNRELLQPGTIEQLSELADAIGSRNYEVAQKIQVDIQREKTEESKDWMVGVKRLINMSKATP